MSILQIKPQQVSIFIVFMSFTIPHNLPLRASPVPSPLLFVVKPSLELKSSRANSKDSWIGSGGGRCRFRNTPPLIFQGPCWFLGPNSLQAISHQLCGYGWIFRNGGGGNGQKYPKILWRRCLQVNTLTLNTQTFVLTIHYPLLYINIDVQLKR